MRLQMKVAVTVGALVMALAPAALAAGKPEGTPPHGEKAKGHGPSYAPGEGSNGTPGPKAGLPAKAKAYGRYCKDESRKHVKGEKGTPFSQCVTEMAKAAVHEHMAPGRVCKEESRKHVKGEKGTPFSQCVKSVVKMRHEEKEAEEAEETETS